MRFVSPVIVINAAAMTGNIIESVSTASIRSTVAGARGPITQCSGYVYHAIWTGSPVGNLRIAATGDGGTTYETVPSTTQAAGGAAGHWLWDINGSNVEQVRFEYVFTSGTGALTVYFSARERA